MKRLIDVFVGDESQRAGVQRHERQGRRESASFEYDPAWLVSSRAFALEPTLPLVAGPQFHKKRGEGSVFHGAIADTEPDGWGRRVILRDHAKRRAASGPGKSTLPDVLDDLDFLLAVDDESRVGALRLRDADGTFLRAREPGRRTTPPLIELARLLGATRAVEQQTETLADLEYLRGRATSLGGMRPKCSVIDDDGGLCLAKFPSIGDPRAVTHGEVLALSLARRAGIDAARARVVSSDDVSVALIRRFDRTAEGGRVMYVSAATLLGADPADEHSYTEIADALRQWGAAPKQDIEELWRRIAFSIAINNVDDHLKNHGFLHAGDGRWRLAPAFDLNPAPDRVRELKTWISEFTGPTASLVALRAVAPHFLLAPSRVSTILAEVHAAVSMWRAVGRAQGMTEAELDAFAPAFAALKDEEWR